MKKLITKIRHFLHIMPDLKDEQAGLFIPNRQVSLIASGIFITLFLSFVAGYFWGHRRAIQRFVAKVEEESFADRINYALYTMNDRDVSEFEQETEDTNGSALGNEDATLTVPEESEDASEEQESTDDSASKQESSPKHSDNKKIDPNFEKKEMVVFVAPLAGFGTLHAATEFIKRVQLIDPSSVVEKRTSKTARGRTVVWYQAMTGEFGAREDLQKFLSVIQKREHIKDIKIVEKRKG